MNQYSKVTYLGCLLDETMSGESMALKTIKKINQTLKFLYRKNRYLTPELRRLLCNVIIIITTVIAIIIIILLLLLVLLLSSILLLLLFSPLLTPLHFYCFCWGTTMKIKLFACLVLSLPFSFYIYSNISSYSLYFMTKVCQNCF